ncbi:LysR family transcriptional regulator [Bordetella trematum]|uniref:LysR family transcriptional regulator n=1 Tax=Bordetella trematum TaxID=123899 RepID=UPI0004715648|nr:LysR family transcriptional regulator [Bordetella trematum]
MINLQENPDLTWRFSLRQLDLFRAVATHGSLRAAARHLGLTQPTLTHAMKQLEHSVGAPLFIRSAQGSRLTPIGQTLLQHSRRALNELQRAQAEIGRLSGQSGGHVSMGFSAAGSTLLPQALPRFQATHPDVSLTLKEVTSAEHDPDWQAGNYDFIITSELDAPAKGDRQRELLTRLPLTPMTRKGSRWLQARSLHALQDALWILPEYGPELLRRLHADQGLAAPQRQLMCLSIQLVFTMLRATDAVCLLRTQSIPMLRERYDLHPVPLDEPLDAMLYVCLSAPDLQQLTPVAQHFADCLRAVQAGQDRQARAARTGAPGKEKTRKA